MDLEVERKISITLWRNDFPGVRNWNGSCPKSWLFDFVEWATEIYYSWVLFIRSHSISRVLSLAVLTLLVSITASWIGVLDVGVLSAFFWLWNGRVGGYTIIDNSLVSIVPYRLEEGRLLWLTLDEDLHSSHHQTSVRNSGWTFHSWCGRIPTLGRNPFLNCLLMEVQGNSWLRIVPCAERESTTRSIYQFCQVMQHKERTRESSKLPDSEVVNNYIDSWEDEV